MKTIQNFEIISAFNLNENIFDSLDNGWMLITAGTENKFNTMTASWGGFGILWNKPVAFIFIRPQRFTFQFTEQENYFTLSFFEEQYRSALQLCGSKSGKDIDKVKESGLTPVKTLHGIAFEQSRLVVECQKLYADNLKAEHFLKREILDKHYPKNDLHRIYIGEIINIYRK